MSEVIISLKNIKKRYKISQRRNGLPGRIVNIFVPKYTLKPAVNGIDIEIKRGESVGFIGPNGAGKSTTIKMMTGILYPDEGDIEILGYIPYKQRIKYVGHIGAVFGQKTQLNWDLPVIDSFELLRHIYNIPKHDFEKKKNMFIELMGMEDFINKPVRQLSLGQRMMSDIVASLLHSPEIIFFDEPTIGLDVVVKNKIREFIRYINKNEGVTIIFTTHDMKDIVETCDRLIIIDKGNKIYDGTVDEVKNKFSNEKKISLELVEGVIENIDNVDIKKIENLKYSLVFDTSIVNTQELISYLVKEYQIKDISITDPDIDVIVRNIYEKGNA